MKVAAANAIALLARENVPDEVVAAYGGDRQDMVKIILFPQHSTRLISVIPVVAELQLKVEQPEKKLMT